MPSGGVRVYEGGAFRGSFGTYVAGDVFRIDVTGGQVTYSINGTLVYTSLTAASFPLVFDASLYTTGATLQGITFSP